MEESKIIQMIKEYFKHETLTEDDISELLQYIKSENISDEEGILKLFKKIDIIDKNHTIDDSEL